MTHNLDENTLKSLQNNLNKNEMIIIKFTADWCAPCNSIKEFIHDIVKSLPDKIKFFEIDVDVGKIKDFYFITNENYTNEFIKDDIRTFLSLIK